VYGPAVGDISNYILRGAYSSLYVTLESERLDEETRKKRRTANSSLGNGDAEERRRVEPNCSRKRYSIFRATYYDFGTLRKHDGTGLVNRNTEHVYAVTVLGHFVRKRFIDFIVTGLS